MVAVEEVEGEEEEGIHRTLTPRMTPQSMTGRARDTLGQTRVMPHQFDELRRSWKYNRDMIGTS